VIDYTFDDFKTTVDALFGEHGCPWDKSRTLTNLRGDLLEECYEAVDAVDKGDAALLCEELGDVMLAVMLYAKTAERGGLFGVGDVIDGIVKKIIRRHSHVFGGVKAETPEESLKNWENEKRLEKSEPTRAERLRDVPKTFPALMRAQSVLKRASGYGGETPDKEALLDGLVRSAAEIKDAANAGNVRAEDVGAILLNIADISRLYEINAELSLTNMIETFINVFGNAGNAVLTAFDGIQSSFEEEIFDEQD